MYLQSFEEEPRDGLIPCIIGLLQDCASSANLAFQQATNSQSCGLTVLYVAVGSSRRVPAKLEDAMTKLQGPLIHP